MADIPITNNKTPILQEPALLSLCQITWCSPHIHHNVVVCRIICAVAVCIATVYIFCTLSSYKLEMFNLIWTKQSGCRTTYCLKKPSQYVCCFSQDPFGSCTWLLQLFDNRPIVCLKQVEYVGGKSQNIAESFQTQMMGTWFVYCVRFVLRGKIVIWFMENHQENRTSWKFVFQSSLQINYTGIELIHNFVDKILTIAIDLLWLISFN